MRISKKSLQKVCLDNFVLETKTCVIEMKPNEIYRIKRKKGEIFDLFAILGEGYTKGFSGKTKISSRFVGVSFPIKLTYLEGDEFIFKASNKGLIMFFSQFNKL